MENGQDKKTSTPAPDITETILDVVMTEIQTAQSTAPKPPERPAATISVLFVGRVENVYICRPDPKP